MSRLLAALAREDDGGVLVQVAIALPVLILFTSLVVDIGNWFVHARHLQMRADAAALASARDFTYPCGNEAIVGSAIDYGGRTYNGAAGDRLGTTPAGVKEGASIGPIGERGVHMLINSKHWPLQETGPQDETVVEGAPCDTRMVDVKLTETAVPWLFRAANVDFINAHARVEIRKMAKVKGPLPITAIDTNPKLARVEWVDESDGRVLGGSTLVRSDATDELAEWTNAEGFEGSPGPAEVNVDAKNIGMRVVLSAGTSTTCGEPLVECYDLNDDAAEPMHIRGWSADATGVHARDVHLLSGTCADPYFVANESACTVGIRAELAGFPAGTTFSDIAVTAYIDGGANKGYQLTRMADGSWQRASGLPVPPQGGPLPVRLKWAYSPSNRCPSGATCSGDFGVVQRVWSAHPERSGPIKAVQIWEGGELWKNSLQRCSESYTTCKRNLTVTLGIEPTFQDARGPDDPVRDLRIQVDDGEQTQSLDCDPDIGFEEELANGCDETYKRNEGSACPAANDLDKADQPWDCVAVITGNKLPFILDGLNMRIFGDPNADAADCLTAPNRWTEHWTADPATGEWVLDPSISEDPRLIQVFVAPFGTFDGHGTDMTVPITNFAYFYATGWSGEGGKEGPCSGLGDDPVPGTGWIVGHFVDYIPTLKPGQAGDDMCDLTDLSSCISIMTI